MFVCFICLESTSQQSKKASSAKHSKNLKSLVLTVSKLLKIKGISEDEWDFVDNLETALVCSKCGEELAIVKKVYDHLKETEKKLRECLARVEEFVRKSAATEKAKSCLLYPSCFKFRNDLANRKSESPNRPLSLPVEEESFGRDEGQCSNSLDKVDWCPDDRNQAFSEGAHFELRGKRKLVVIAEEDEKRAPRRSAAVPSHPELKVEPGEDGNASERLHKPKLDDAYEAASFFEGDDYESISEPECVEDEPKAKRRKPSPSKKQEMANYFEYGKRKWICVVEHCGADYTSKANWIKHCDREHPGEEVPENVKWLGTPPPSPKREDPLEKSGLRIDLPFQVITDHLFLYKQAIFVEFNYTHLFCKASDCNFYVKFDYLESFQAMRKHIHANHRGKEYGRKPRLLCRICNTDRLYTHTAFRDHLKEKHPQFGERCKGIGICDCCLRHMNYIQVMAHMFSHKNEEEVAIARELGLGPSRARKLKKSEKTEEEKEMAKNMHCPYEGCDYKTDHKNNLNKHINCRHTAKDERSDLNICPECGARVFGTKYQMDKHMKKFHPPPDVVQNTLHCPHCEKKFIWEKRFLLKQHLKEHTAWNDPSKPFGCEKCKKSFAEESVLKAHYKKIHKSSSSK